MPETKEEMIEWDPAESIHIALYIFDKEGHAQVLAEYAKDLNRWECRFCNYALMQFDMAFAVKRHVEREHMNG